MLSIFSFFCYTQISVILYFLSRRYLKPSSVRRGHRMTEHKRKINTGVFAICGLLIVLIGNIPFFLLRGGIVFPMRDQLDGEIVAFFLGGKYLFSGTTFFPEYMGGVESTALVPPSGLSVLFFYFLSPLKAFIVNNLFVMIFAFVGMYFWNCKLRVKPLIAASVAVLFSFLPFYPVYGLSMAGIPLVAWALFVLADREERIYKQVIAIAAIVLYGLASSLVLSGYAVVIVSCIVFLILLLKKKTDGKGLIRYLSGVIALIAVYSVENRSLISQILGQSGGYVSHKSEYVLTSTPFLETFKKVFLHGVLLEDMYGAILAELLIVAVIYAVKFALKRKVMRESAESESIAGRLVIFVISAVLIALFSAIYRERFVVDVLNKSNGALKSFQIDRFTWMLPFIWYTALALILSYIFSVLKKKVLAPVAVAVLLLPCAYIVLSGSVFKENAMELVRKDSNALNWDAFFCKDEFTEVAAYIEDSEGLSQSEYKVGCLGIEPSVAVLNGFYTIDGYSNNYDVEYKHRFRHAISDELKKNDYNRSYFDNWGNRCYLFSSEYYGNEFLSKYVHPHFDDLEFDTEALKDLSCSYILAAGEIANAEGKGYELLKVFDRADWTYFVYLYKVK